MPTPVPVDPSGHADRAPRLSPRESAALGDIENGLDKDDPMLEWALAGWRPRPTKQWWIGQLVWSAYAVLTVVVAALLVPALVGPWVALLPAALTVEMLMMVGGGRG